MMRTISSMSLDFLCGAGRYRRLIAKLICSECINLSKWGVYVNSRARLAQSYQRRFSHWLHNPRMNVQRLYTLHAQSGLSALEFSWAWISSLMLYPIFSLPFLSIHCYTAFLRTFTRNRLKCRPKSPQKTFWIPLENTSKLCFWTTSSKSANQKRYISSSRSFCFH